MDTAYLAILTDAIKTLFRKVKPDLVFNLSGVDVIETDKLGRISMTLSGCKRSDELVLEACKAHQVPVAVSMGGGYAHKISDIVEAHANTFRVAKELYF
ncbi:MAG: hypothetical protein OCD76_19975 [Reichenbachiella sp.]